MNSQILCVASMLNRALNTLNYRLMDHCNRVGYLTLKMSQAENRFNDIQLTQISFLAMLHDIGAYQTETLDTLDDPAKVFNYEVKNSIEHSIYSYLFLKEYEFFSEYVDAVLFHHFFYEKLNKSDCKNKDLASKIFIADKIDLLISKEMVETPEDIYKFLENPTFCPHYASMARKAEEEYQALTKALDNSFMQDFSSFLEENKTHDGLRSSLAHMLSHIIDFRSKDTVTHTAATVEISTLLGKLFNLSVEEINEIHYGAMLHDVGKISTSLLVLEKPDRLNTMEYSIMKDHVLISEYILKDCVSEKVFNIAVRHHEKLDGTGYPRGLKFEDLSLAERIVAVADLLSALLGRRAYKEPFPKEKVISIIKSTADEGKLCLDVVEKAIENIDLIYENVEKCSDISMNRYDTIQKEAEELLLKYKS